MSVSMLGVGECATIVGFRGNDNIKRRLHDLGFIKGEEVKIIGENLAGLIIIVKGVKIALNRGLASLIVVS